MRYKCEECYEEGSVAYYNNGSYCFACNKKGNKQILMSINNNKSFMINQKTNIIERPNLTSLLTENELLYLSKYEIYKDTCKSFFISHDLNTGRLAFPILDSTMHMWKCYLRDITGKSKAKWFFWEESPKFLSVLNPINNKWTKTVIVEDIISGIKCSYFQKTIILGGLNWKYPSLIKELDPNKEIIVFFDSDMAGKNAAKKFKKEFNFLCNIKILSPGKDPKEYFYNELKELLQ